jgi:hypothetical protein
MLVHKNRYNFKDKETLKLYNVFKPMQTLQKTLVYSTTIGICSVSQNVPTLYMSSIPIYPVPTNA